MISFALVERQSQLCLFEFLYRTYSQGMFQIAYGILMMFSTPKIWLLKPTSE